jgi:hypothetical protein
MTTTETAVAPAPVSFRISTYWRRRRSEPGLTRMDSQRLLLSQALDWVLGELPDEAAAVVHDTSADVTVIRIDWNLVPDQIRYGTTPPASAR